VQFDAHCNQMPGSNNHCTKSGSNTADTKKAQLKYYQTKDLTQRPQKKKLARYLTSTEAPASTNFFLIVSASSLVTPLDRSALRPPGPCFFQAQAGDFADGLDDIDLG